MTAAPNNHPAQKLLDALAEAIEQQSFVQLSLAAYQGDIADLQRILLRVVSIKRVANLSFIYRYKTKDVTKNLPIQQGLSAVADYLQHDFNSALLKLTDQELQWQRDKKGQIKMSQQMVNAVALDASRNMMSHNREKKRYLDQTQPFLTALGVTDAQRQIIPAMSRKWKQINKFIEISDGAFAQIQHDTNQAVRVVDFGSGKGYLTFAIREYIAQHLNLKPKVTGVELRNELVQLCNTAVSDLNLIGLDFYQGDVQNFSPDGLDVMIALHACDIATDYALYTGIRLGASIIMCAPCCHKELRPQLKAPSLLKPMLAFGVHLGQQAEMLTDSLRALLLEAHGYETKVFEFVALEHTSKNKMILAVKKAKTAQKQAEVLAQVAELKAFYGVRQQTLERLLHVV